jgi:hypothetical protein
MKRTVDSLNVNRPASRWESLAGVKLRNVEATREHVLQELVELESQLGRLKTQQGPFDFSMIQTYKEMIASRKRFFDELNRR